jgi:hypothetical protein
VDASSDCGVSVTVCVCVTLGQRRRFACLAVCYWGFVSVNGCLCLCRACFLTVPFEGVVFAAEPGVRCHLGQRTVTEPRSCQVSSTGSTT